MRLEIVHVGCGNVHVYGGIVVNRVIAFNEKYGLKADPTHVMVELTNSMVATEPTALVLVGVSDGGAVVGHAIVLLQELFGIRTAMIYQLEFDDDAIDGREDVMQQGWNQIESWADNHHCTAIRAWAMNEKLAEVFRRFGLENKNYQFVEVEI